MGVGRKRLVDVVLDEHSLGRGNPDIEHERAVAIYDLLEDNSFAPSGHDGGPYRLTLSIQGRQLRLEVAEAGIDPLVTHLLSLTPFRRIVRDYYLVCESYFEMIRTASPSRIEAVDMGRRSLHNEGSQLLMDRLGGKLDVDFDTARRLFTLICVLYWKG